MLACDFIRAFIDMVFLFANLLWLLQKLFVNRKDGLRFYVHITSCSFDVDALLHIMSMHIIYRHEFDLYICRVRYLLSATMYYRPLNLIDRQTNQFTCSTNL